jgi:hypothetical protein
MGAGAADQGKNTANHRQAERASKSGFHYGHAVRAWWFCGPSFLKLGHDFAHTHGVFGPIRQIHDPRMFVEKLALGAPLLLRRWFAIATISLAVGRFVFGLLAPILRERAANVVLFLGEVAAVVTPDVSLVSRLWLD